MNHLVDKKDGSIGRDPVHGEEDADDGMVCPLCGARLIQEKCKIVCRSESCVYRIILNCAEF